MRNFYIIGLLALSSCASIRYTTSTVADITTSVEQIPTVVDLNVSESKVCGETTWDSGLFRRSRSIKEETSNVIADIVNANNADVLVQPEYTTTTSRLNIFATRYTLKVTGYPATYTHFRPATMADVKLINDFKYGYANEAPMATVIVNKDGSKTAQSSGIKSTLTKKSSDFGKVTGDRFYLLAQYGLAVADSDSQYYSIVGGFSRTSRSFMGAGLEYISSSWSSTDVSAFNVFGYYRYSFGSNRKGLFVDGKLGVSFYNRVSRGYYYDDIYDSTDIFAGLDLGYSYKFLDISIGYSVSESMFDSFYPAIKIGLKF